MFKKREIVMMHTYGKETSAIMLGVMPNVATITKDVLDDVSDWMRFGKPYHLYVLSNEPLNKGDLYMSKYHSIISKYNGVEKLPEGWKKIIATTNLDLDFPLRLPQLRESFIIYFVVQYNRGNIITEIDVEYEEYHGIDTSIAEINYVSGDGSLGWKGKNDLRDFKLKINLDNTINIKPIKELSKDEIDRFFVDMVCNPKEEPKPHSFCKTPEEKCTMNYCDENGCQNRKRELVEPKPKQETLEEAASRVLYNKYPYHPPQDGGYWKDMFKEGVKWQQEQEKNKYSEEDMLSFTQTIIQQYKFGNTNIEQLDLLKETLRQFKKK